MDRFDIAQGIYWYCADYHDGQWSREYSVLSTLGYKPGAMERGPDTEDSRDVYQDLVGGGEEELDLMLGRLENAE